MRPVLKAVQAWVKLSPNKHTKRLYEKGKRRAIGAFLLPIFQRVISVFLACLLPNSPHILFYSFFRPVFLPTPPRNRRFSFTHFPARYFCFSRVPFAELTTHFVLLFFPPRFFANSTTQSALFFYLFCSVFFANSLLAARARVFLRAAKIKSSCSPFLITSFLLFRPRKNPPRNFRAPRRIFAFPYFFFVPFFCPKILP